MNYAQAVAVFDQAIEVLAEQSAALERARVVGVLDAFSRERSCVVVCGSTGDDRWAIQLLGHSAIVGHILWQSIEATPDAARAAAAKAIESGEV